MLSRKLIIQSTQKWLTPFTDIYDLEDRVIVLADMPGVSIESTDIRVEKNQLIIHGGCSRGKDGRPLIRQCPRYDYYRMFQLSEAIDPEGIKAEMKNGTLTLMLPKKRLTQSTSIPISTVPE